MTEQPETCPTCGVGAATVRVSCSECAHEVTNPGSLGCDCRCHAIADKMIASIGRVSWDAPPASPSLGGAASEAGSVAVRLAREAIEQSEKATPGPWIVEADPFHGTSEKGKLGPLLICTGPKSDWNRVCIAKVQSTLCRGQGRSPFDGDWIAAARSREPLLARAVLSQSAALDALRAALRKYGRHQSPCGMAQTGLHVASRKCYCGFDAALAEAGTAGKET